MAICKVPVPLEKSDFRDTRGRTPWHANSSSGSRGSPLWPPHFLPVTKGKSELRLEGSRLSSWCWPGSRVSPQPRGDPRFNSHTTCMALCAKSVWLSPLSRGWSNCDSRKLGGLPKVPSRSEQRSTGLRKGESCSLR